MAMMASLKIAVFASAPDKTNSEAHYRALLMSYALLRARADVTFITDRKPSFLSDLEPLAPGRMQYVLTDDFRSGLPQEHFDFLILPWAEGRRLDIYEAALAFAWRTKARLALINSASASIDAGSSQLSGSRLWDGWLRSVSEGGLVISSLRVSHQAARRLYTPARAGRLRFEVCAPPINSPVADRASMEPKDGSILAFPLASDSHWDPSPLLALDPAILANQTLRILSEEPVDAAFLSALRAGFEPVGARIEAHANVSDEDKFRLIGKAQALLFLSRSEGFSYPPVEAAYMGTEVACYDLPALRETVGGIAHMATQDDTVTLSEALHAALAAANKDRRAELRAAVADLVGIDAVATRIGEILLRSREAIAPPVHIQGAVLRGRGAALDSSEKILSVPPPDLRSLRRTDTGALVLSFQFVAPPTVRLRSLSPGIALSDVWLHHLCFHKGQAVLQATAVVSALPDGGILEIEASGSDGQAVERLKLRLEASEPQPPRRLRLRQLWPAPSHTRVVFEAPDGERLAASCDGSEWTEAPVIGGIADLRLPRTLDFLGSLVLYLQEADGGIVRFKGLPPFPTGSSSVTDTRLNESSVHSLEIACVNSREWSNGVLQHPGARFAGALCCHPPHTGKLPKAGDWLQLPSMRHLRLEAIDLEGKQVLLHFAEPLDPPTEGYPGRVTLAEFQFSEATPWPLADDPLWTGGVWSGPGPAKRCGVILPAALISNASPGHIDAGSLSVLQQDGREIAIHNLSPFGGDFVAWLAEPLAETGTAPVIRTVIRNAEAHGLHLHLDPRPLEVRGHRDLTVAAQARARPGDVLVLNDKLVRVITAVTSQAEATILHLDLAPPAELERLRFASPAEARLPGALQARFPSPISTTDVALPSALVDHFRQARPALLDLPSNDRPRVLFASIVQAEPNGKIVTKNFIAHLVEQGFSVDLLLIGDVEPEEIHAQFGDRVRVFTWSFPDWQSEPTARMRSNLRVALQTASPADFEQHLFDDMQHSASLYHPFFIVADPVIRLARALYATNEYNSIVCDYTHMARIPCELSDIRPLPSVAIITHEALSRLITRHGGAFIDTEYRLCTPEAERDVLNSVPGALILASSEREANYFRDIGVTNAVALCEYDCLRECGRYQTSPKAFAGRRLIFNASGNRANQLAIRWFIEHCWDRVLAAVPQAQLVICGAVCDHIPAGIHNAISLGVVRRDRLMQEFSGSSLAINPTVGGAELRALTVEAACVGLPSVCTPDAVEGLEAHAKRFCLTADNPASFAEACIRLLSDRQTWRALRKDALNFAAERFSTASIYGPVDLHMGWDNGAETRWAAPRPPADIGVTVPAPPTPREQETLRRMELLHELRALGETGAATRLAESLLQEPDVNTRMLENLADDDHISPMRLWVAAARILAADPANASALTAQTLALARSGASEASLAAWRQLALATPGSVLAGSTADASGNEDLRHAAQGVRLEPICVAFDVKHSICDIVSTDKRVGTGWSHMEHWGVWTDGPYARLDLSIPPTTSGLRVTLSVHSAPIPGAPPLEVRALIESCDGGVFRIERRHEKQSIELGLAPHPDGSRTTIGVDLFIANPAPPRSEDGVILDSRQLGLALNTIEVRQEKLL